MARTVSLNKRFNRGVPARAYIKHLHVYTEGEITEKEYLNAFCREIIPVHPEFRPAAYAGNFIISPTGELRLVSMFDLPPETRVLCTEDGYKIVFGKTADGENVYILA